MPVPVEIDDPADPRIAAYRAIRERDLVGREGRFVAEGEVVLRLLLRSSRFRPESVLIDRRRLPALAALLSEVPSDVPVYAAAQAVIDGVAGFSIHRGVLAMGRRGTEPAAEALVAALPARARLLVAVGIANHDNMGGLFRNAAAFGVDAVLLDPTACDPLYRKAIRVSVGAALTVPFARAASLDALLDLLARAGIATYALSPEGATDIAALVPPGRFALVVGTEGPGLPEAVLRRLPGLRIPMAGGFDSLNVATAAAVALYALEQAAAP
ncbi:MAG TPA: RNA methyltransferase [Hyphomicrobiales bacterium]|nr:RNA methyltransferase [Hyphomicrobiales bacterium]